MIGGGFPIGVIAGKRDYMDALDGGAWQYGDDSVPTVGVTYFAGTFVRHPLALAAAQGRRSSTSRRTATRCRRSSTLRTAAMADELNAFCREVGAPHRDPALRLAVADVLRSRTIRCRTCCSR